MQCEKYSDRSPTRPQGRYINSPAPVVIYENRKDCVTHPFFGMWTGNGVSCNEQGCEYALPLSFCNYAASWIIIII